MSVALPKEIKYDEPIPSLPENSRSFQLAATPVNGSSFLPSSLIQVDLTKRGFIDPQSIYIRYRAVHTATAGTAEMIGTPVYTPIQKLETFIGSTQLEAINQYNQTANMLVNITTDVASKYGMQYGYGFGSATATNPALSTMDGRVFTTAATENYFVSAPLPCMLSACEKLIPSFALPQIRLQFTLDSLANMFAVQATGTSLTISNFEVCYTIIDMGAEIENHIMSLGKFMLKTQSFFNISSTLNSGTNGSITIPYNVQFASIKSLFAIFAGTSIGLNRWGDAYDPTSAGGDFSFSIAGVQYPQRTLSTINNKAGLLQSLRQAVGSIYGSTNSLSINAIEFLINSGTATTSAEPAKFYIGVSTEKMHTDALMTGISSMGSAILLNMNTANATAQTHTVNLIINYDALLQIDTINGQVSVAK